MVTFLRSAHDEVDISSTEDLVYVLWQYYLEHSFGLPLAEG